MKHFIPGLFLFILPYFLSGQSMLDQQVDFEIEKETPVADALRQLAKQTGLSLSFSPDFFAGRSTSSRSWSGQNIQTILTELLADEKVNWKISGKRIIIFKSKPKRLTISGFIEDEQSGERLIAATIYCKEHDIGTISNEYGFYSLSLPAGKATLQYSYLGYAPQERSFDLNKNRQLTQHMQSSNQLPEVLVQPQADGSQRYGSHSAHFLDRERIRHLPGLGGEPDPLRAAQQLPGINTAVDGLAGLMVRGGDPGQNLLLLDGVPVYIPYHLMGLYSVYNARTVNSAKVMKGSFPARYGGRLSSVFDVRTREGNKYKYGGEAGINLTTTNALVEGPIIKGKGSFLLAGRRSHSGFLLSPALEQLYFLEDEGNLKSEFHDLNAKISSRLSARDKIYLSLFTGSDKFEKYFAETDDNDLINSSEMELYWNNTIGALRWNHLFSEKLFSNTTFTYSWFNFDLGLLEYSEGEYPEDDDLAFLDSRSNNEDLGLLIDFTYLPNADHRVKFGAGFSRKEFIPDLTYFEESDEELEELEEFSLDALQGLVISPLHEVSEAFGYIEDDIRIDDQWHVNLGLRATSFFTSTENFYSAEPRVALRYHPNDKFNVQLAGGQMRQNLHLISHAALSLPNDLWTPASANLLPQNAWQAELGLQGRFAANWKWQLDGYYKYMNNLYAFPDNPEYLDRVNEDELDQYLTQGEGQAYGLEAMLAHNGSTAGGQLVMALSRTDRQYEEQNLGEAYPFEYDQRFNAKLNLYKIFGRRWRLDLSAYYHSPNPRFQFQVLSAVPVDPTELNPMGQKNESRGKAYHRIDAQLSYNFKTSLLSHSLSAGVYNAYNHSNVAYYQAEDHGVFTAEPILSLPFLPSLSYSLKFNQ